MVDTSRSEQKWLPFWKQLSKLIFMNENCGMFILISEKFDFIGSINNKPALIQIMAWCKIDSKHYQNQYWPSLLIHICITWPQWVNTLRPRQNGRHFPNDTFKRIFLNENARISIKISLRFVPKSPINNIPALVQIMAWRRPGIKPLSEPMMVRLLTHICVTWPQWVKMRA